MGLMRRVESRMESAAGVKSKDAPSTERRRDRSKRESRPYVKPADLASKLTKEMDDHSVARSSCVSACNSFAVYLCPEDAEHLRGQENEITRDLERRLRKHARAMRYELPGDVGVRLLVDEDLPAGRFGILAERVATDAAVPSSGEPAAEAAAPAAAAPSSRRAARARSATPAAANGMPTATRVIEPEEAAHLGLAHQTLVVRSGSRVREFSKGRIVIGRAKDTDFQLDDPNVSRRHAAIYWENGRVMVEDLDSTNGTLVNGYPILNTPLKQADVVYIGGHKLTVETR